MDLFHYDFGGPASGTFYGVFVDPKQAKKIKSEFNTLIQRLEAATAPRGAVSWSGSDHCSPALCCLCSRYALLKRLDPSPKRAVVNINSEPGSGTPGRTEYLNRVEESVNRLDNNKG